ncbi:MAG: RES family NAD+ phosphorylase [Pseudomonadota bacterium]
MTKEPKVSAINWPDARRIISSRYPPVDLFEDIADPRDWELLAAAEARTNPRINESIGRLDLVPLERRVAGAGASYVMAPFVHVSPEWAGRFDDGTFGAYYVAKSFDTAVAETAFHKGQFFSATSEEPGWLAQMRELVGAVDNAFHDIRGDCDFENCLARDSYVASHELARSLRADGSNGIAFPSVRDPGGECIGAFWPSVVGLPVQGRHLAYHFDGSRIDLVKDESSGDVWRLV